MNIVLTGFMATGKSTVGEKLAKKLNYKYIDVDTIIEERTKMKIKDIFKIYGERYFRDLESEIIKEVSQLDECVISVGGGAVLREENMENLEKNGIIVNLKASPQTIYNRIKDFTDRPLLDRPNPMETIEKLLKYREPLYERCHISIQTDDIPVDIVVEEITKKLMELKK